MKNIVGYELFFDGHSIAGSGKVDEQDLVFKDIRSKMERRLQERTKKIIMAFLLKDDSSLNVVLFNGSTRPSSVMHDATRDGIKQLLGKLEEVEKSLSD